MQDEIFPSHHKQGNQLGEELSWRDMGGHAERFLGKAFLRTVA
jgi:hypothetical protein